MSLSSFFEASTVRCDAPGPKEGEVKEEEITSEETVEEKGAPICESCFALLGSCFGLESVVVVVV